MLSLHWYLGRCFANDQMCHFVNVTWFFFFVRLPFFSPSFMENISFHVFLSLSLSLFHLTKFRSQNTFLFPHFFLYCFDDRLNTRISERIPLGWFHFDPVVFEWVLHRSKKKRIGILQLSSHFLLFTRSYHVVTLSNDTSSSNPLLYHELIPIIIIDTASIFQKPNTLTPYSKH